MKFKKIVGFGDSWVWGDELLDPTLVDHKYAHPVMIENTPYREQNCFLGQLGTHYNVLTENFGIPGGSLQSTIWTYIWWLNHETIPLDQCAVLVGLTDPNRQTFYNPKHVSFGNEPPWNRFVHSTRIHGRSKTSDDPWTQMIKAHTVLTDCNAAHKLNYQQTVLFFQGQSCCTTGPLLQFNTMFGILNMTCSSLIWPTQSLNHLLQPGVHHTHKDLFAPNGHPNEKGHKVICNHLIAEIDCVTMT